jgi:hypothetical protein
MQLGMNRSITKTRLALVYGTHFSTQLVKRGPAKGIIVEAVYNNQRYKLRGMRCWSCFTNK